MKTPPKTSSNSPDSPLDDALRATRFRLRLSELGAAALLMLALGLAGSLAIIIADHAVPGGLGVWTRWGLRWLLLGAEACLLIALIALPLLRRLSDLYAARQMEQADPSFHNDLTAALQLRGKTGPAAATAAAVRRSAARQARKMANGAPSSPRSIRLAGLAVGVAAAAFCLYWIFAPKSTAASFQRAMGLGNPPAPTRTKILSLLPPEETTVLTGDEVLFEARIRQPAGPAVLSISRDGRTVLDEDTLTMTLVEEPGPGEAYRAAWKAVAADGWAKFRLACGDAQTSWRQIRVLPTPALRRVRVKCDWPKYTHLAPRITEGGRVEGPAGAKATVTAEANLPVKRASLVFRSDGRTLEMTPDDTGRVLSVTFRIRTPETYVVRYELRDIEAQAESIPYKVAVTPDRPPTIQLDQPAGDATLAENESLRILGEAADDFGVGQIELVCTKNGQTTTKPLGRPAAAGATSRHVQAGINAGDLGRAGETVTCTVQVHDLYPSSPGGHVTKSKPFTLTITPPQTTAEQQETTGGADQAGEEQSELAMAQTESNDAQEQDQIRKALSEQEQQPSNNKQASTRSKEAPSSGGKAVSDDQENSTDPREAKKLDQLCEAMENEENGKQHQAASDKDDSSGKDDSSDKDQPDDSKLSDEKNDSSDEGADKENRDDKINVKGEIPSRMTKGESKKKTPPSPKEKKEEQKETPPQTKTVTLQPAKTKKLVSKNESKPAASTLAKDETKTVKGEKKKSDPGSPIPGPKGKLEPMKPIPHGNVPRTQPVKKKVISNSPSGNDDLPIYAIKSKQKNKKKENDDPNRDDQNEPEKNFKEKIGGEPIESEPNQNTNVNKKLKTGNVITDSAKNKSGISGPAGGEGLIGSAKSKKDSKSSISKGNKGKGSKSKDSKNKSDIQKKSGKQSDKQKDSMASKKKSEKSSGDKKKDSAASKKKDEKSSDEKKSDSGKREKADAQEQKGEKSQASSQAQGENKASSSDAAGRQPSSSGKAGGKNQSPPPGQRQGQGQQQNAQPQGEASKNPMGAQMVHDKPGDGEGSAKREGDLEPVDEEALLPGSVESLESVGRALEKARKLIDADAVDPKLLDAMGMTLPQFKDFVEKYTRVYEKKISQQEQEKQRRIIQAPPTGEAEVRRRVGRQTGNVTADASPEKHRSAKDRRASPAEVSPEYRRQLEAYLRAVSEGEEK